MSKTSGKPFLLGAVVGGVLGAATALLLAPKPGRELREDIGGGLHTVGDKTQQIAQTVSQHTSELVGKAKEAVGAVKDGVKSWREGKTESAVPAEDAETVEIN